MKKYIVYLVVFVLNLCYTPVFAGDITLTCEVTDCAEIEELYLYEFEGFGFSKLQTAKKDKKGLFVFKVPEGKTRFYYLGKDPTQMKPIILGKEEKVLVLGSCADFGRLHVDGIGINSKYEGLKVNIGKLKAKSGKAQQQHQQALRDPAQMQAALDNLAALDKEKIALLDSFGDKYPLLTEIAAINTYLSYANNQGDFYDEVDYFANEFFRFVDFKSELYKDNPWVFEAFKEYTQTLSSINLEKELHQSYLDEVLNKFPLNSSAYQLALSGIVVGLEGRQHPNYAMYGKRLLKKYEKSHADIIGGLKKKIELAGAFEVGAVAPDFAQLTPAGDSLSLSDLRGKVVLVDFWASWCGPCRRENPHVKKLYDKYNKDGFEVLGISLDRTKGAWEKAIEKDDLPWHHISDLKGWKNEVAKMYSVSSIPHTILLDQEGRIVASKLRGQQLDQQLAQIFGK